MPEKSSAMNWLHAEVRANYPDAEELITAAKAVGSQKIPWLLDRLRERGNAELVEQFRLRRNAEATARNWERKRERLARIEANIVEGKRVIGRGSDTRLSYMEAAAERLRAAIVRHDAQLQEEETDVTTI